MKTNTRYLVRRSTNEVFIWTEILAKRNDLEEVYAENPKAALDRSSMPDPKNISLAQLEDMTKAELLVFSATKLGVELDAKLGRAAILDEVKVQVWSRPSSVNADSDPVRQPKGETRAMASPADARRAGM